MSFAWRTCIMAILTVAPLARGASPYFGIEIIDDQTDRGVPLVELETVSHVRFVTDSNGLAAIDDPAMMGRKVFFGVKSFGYEFPADGFGSRGVALDVKAGEIATLKIHRLNIAERLYRTTGEGIYRDTVLLGRKPPIAQPLLNAQVVGQDSVQAAVYRDKIHIFWGDTSRQSYPLGLFKMAGAIADLPGKGGLDPSVGIDLHYFQRPDGFAREMAPLPDKGLVWVDGVMVLNDEQGRERMLAHANIMQGLDKRLGRCLVIYNDQTDAFERLKEIDLNAPLAPAGHPFRIKRDGKEYFYFPTPYPCVRALAKWEAVIDLSSYEAFTPLAAGSHDDKKSPPPLERDGAGKVVFAWKKNAAPLSPQQLKELIDAKEVRREELSFRLQDAATAKAILLHGGSVYYNEFRQRWIMIALESFGASMVGEVWYAEASQPEGPWMNAVKIVTHDRITTGGLGGPRHETMDFYNPKQHPFFDQQGGRIIYFEGTYTNTFSGNPTPTPRYDYNQIMYRLDLADPRLKPAQE